MSYKTLCQISDKGLEKLLKLSGKECFDEDFLELCYGFNEFSTKHAYPFGRKIGYTLENLLYENGLINPRNNSGDYKMIYENLSSVFDSFLYIELGDCSDCVLTSDQGYVYLYFDDMVDHNVHVQGAGPLYKKSRGNRKGLFSVANNMDADSYDFAYLYF